MFEMYPDEYGTKIEVIAEYLRKNCQPYLREINYNPSHYALYRGMKHNSEDFTVKEVRLDDRRAQDMDSRSHDALNGYFTKKFGEPFRNALFVAGTPHVAESFGNLYAVFPMGNFTYIWTPEVYDLYTEYGSDIYLEVVEHKDTKAFIELMDSLKYRNTDLPKAIESDHEIMIRCKKYAAVRVKGEPMEAMAKLTVALTNEMKGYKK